MKTLEQYYPRGARLFYGYPSGENSAFYNLVPPWVEELVAFRPLAMTTEMDVFVFSASVNQQCLELLEVSPKNIIVFPEDINSDLCGRERNLRVMKFLCSYSDLIMAQPFNSPDINQNYLIPVEIVQRLNDKNNLRDVVPEENLARRYEYFENGAFFALSRFDIFPCVVKVANSSSGDGVRICKNSEDFISVQKEWASLNLKIFIEEYIDYSENVGVQFAIPYDETENIEILGCFNQITSESGEFLGGIVGNSMRNQKIEKLFLESVLPKVRALGWYGVGNYDVLMACDGRIIVIDPNLRLTGMSAFIFRSLSGKYGEKSVIPFSGVLSFGIEELLKLNFVDIVALTRNDLGYCFNGGFVYDQEESRKEAVLELLRKGVSSDLLSKLAEL